MNTRKLFLYCFLGILTLYIISILFLKIAYEANDDVLMLLISSGYLTGRPDPHLVFINIIIGNLISFFYHWFPRFEWYTFHLIACQIVSLTTILFVFLEKKNNRYIVVFMCLLISAITLQFLVHLQFTTTAFLLASSGLLIFNRNLTLNVKLYSLSYILMILIFTWSFMLRIDAFLGAILIGSVFFIPFLKQKNTYYAAFITFGFISIAFLINNREYNSNQDWSYYTNFNKLRGKLNVADNPNVVNIDTLGITKENANLTSLNVKLFTNEFILTKPINLDQLILMNKYVKNQNLLEFNFSDLLSKIKNLLLKFRNEWLILGFILIFAAINKSYFSVLSIVIFIGICFILSLNMFVKPRVFYGLFFIIVCFFNYLILDKENKMQIYLSIFLFLFSLYFFRQAYKTSSENKVNEIFASNKLKLIQLDEVCLFRGNFLVQNLNPFQISDVLKTKKIYFCLWLMASPVYKAHIAKIFGMKTNQSDYIFEDIVSNYSGKVVSLTEISKELETYLASLGIHLKEDVQFPPKTKYKFQKQ